MHLAVKPHSYSILIFPHRDEALWHLVNCANQGNSLPSTCPQDTGEKCCFRDNDKYRLIGVDLCEKKLFLYLQSQLL